MTDADGVTLRVLDVVEVVAGDEGEAYAGLVGEVLSVTGTGGRRGVLQRSVERVLTRIRDGERSISLRPLTAQ